ncbi:MAG: hypothetical protein ABW150_15720 [Candidatus Thiodiazotropha sp.]
MRRKRKTSEEEIKRRIDGADALVALITSWTDTHGNPSAPPYVNDEFGHAKAQEKDCIRILHKDLPAQGMYQPHEYIPLDPDNSVGAVLKLMRTIAVWKRKAGSSRLVRGAAWTVTMAGFA